MKFCLGQLIWNPAYKTKYLIIDTSRGYYHIQYFDSLHIVGLTESSAKNFELYSECFGDCNEI